MVLTDLTSARVSGGFWTNQIWVFVLLLTYDIVLGIALRLATLGATKVSFEAAENVGFMCAESGEIQDLEDEEQLIEMGIKASHAFNLTQYRLLEACVAFSFVNVLVCSLWAHLANPADGCEESRCWRGTSLAESRGACGCRGRELSHKTHLQGGICRFQGRDW